MIVVVSVVMLLYALHPAARLAVGQVSGSVNTQLGAAALPRAARSWPATEGRGTAPPRHRVARRSCAIAVLILVRGLPDPAAVRDARVLDAGQLRQATGSLRTQPRAFAAILSYPEPRRRASSMSLQIAVLTVIGMLLLLVPTMVWTVVRVPRMRRVVEFLCLLPLAIPAIVIVVGIAPDLPLDGPEPRAPSGASPLTLALINIILVLPYAYRAIDSSLRGDRHRDARRRGAQPRCRLAADDPPGHRAEHPRRRSSRPRCSPSRSCSASSRSRRCSRSTPSRWSSSCSASATPFVAVAVSLRRPVLRVRPAVRHLPVRPRGGDRRTQRVVEEPAA